MEAQNSTAAAKKGAGKGATEKTGVVLVEPSGQVYREARVSIGTSMSRRAQLSALKRCAFAALPRDGCREQCRRFYLVGTFPEGDGGHTISLYGYHTGPGRPNRHELPPGLSDEPLLWGPIVVVRQEGAEFRDITAAEYQAFLAKAVAEESLGESDSERSTDGSDNGSDLENFIVGDDVFD